MRVGSFGWVVAVTGFLVSIIGAFGQESGVVPVTDNEKAKELLRQYTGQDWQNFMARFTASHVFPNSPEAERSRREAKEKFALFSAIPDTLPAQFLAHKYRFMSILETELAVAYGQIDSKMYRGDREALVKSALEHLTRAEQESRHVAPGADQYTPQRWQFLYDSEFFNQVDYIKATAVAVQWWDQGRPADLKQEVKQLWDSIDPEYRRLYTPAASELRKALDMWPYELNDKILAVAFGSFFLLLLVVIALVVKNPTDFQLFVLRVVLAIAAAACAVVIPGAINVNIKGIGAGGGFGVLLIIYLLNPAKLITQQKKKKRTKVKAEEHYG